MTVLRPSPVVLGAALYLLVVVAAGVLVSCDAEPGPDEDGGHSGGY